MAHAPIPVCQSLDAIYNDAGVIARQGERWNHISIAFEEQFGRKPTHIVRAPGRVNLIGEHIDYALFGVFPAAVEPDILMAIAKSPREDGTIIAENMDAKYKAATFKATRNDSGEWVLPIDTSKLSWESYVKAGYFGVLNEFYSKDQYLIQPQAFDLLVTGSVPAGSGLSSSAAMVVASSLAFLVMNNHLEGMTKGALVEMAMENERRVGVNSGGMDQAASVISDNNCALYITFHPQLEAEPVPIPASTKTHENPVFIIANSLVVSDKAVTAKTQYNLRVVETLVGARTLARSLGVNVGPSEKITYKEVLDRWTGNKNMGPDAMKAALGEILKKVEALKPSDGASHDGVTMEQMVEASGLSEPDFDNLYLSWVEVEADHFQLYKRAKHVYSEALRVLEFRDTCLKAQTNGSMPLKRLGTLMNESQQSCSELFECSCPELDELTRLARSAGAIGSRLTGAGWGGCTVSLVAEANVAQFMSKVRETYAPYQKLSDEQLRQAMFATKPGSGACVYLVM